MFILDNSDYCIKTAVMIINIIISAWSWKKINCSMTGDALSCNVKFNHVAIVSNESL